jgi:hypothetical protein
MGIEWMTRTILSLIVCTGVGASVSSLAAPPPNADPALATWFRSLKTPNGTACCDVADCRRASSRMTPTGYEVRIDGQWIPVPWERVLRRTDNPTGEAVVCSPPTEVGTIIFCFVRPPEI